MKFAISECVPISSIDGIEGVCLAYTAETAEIQNEWLAWFPSNAITQCNHGTLGMLCSRHCAQADFCQVESHDREETFYMVSGTGTMLLSVGHKWSLVSFPEGSLLKIAPGVPHYFGPSISAAAVCVVAGCQGSNTRLFDI